MVTPRYKDVYKHEGREVGAVNVALRARLVVWEETRMAGIVYLVYNSYSRNRLL